MAGTIRALAWLTRILPWSLLRVLAFLPGAIGMGFRWRRIVLTNVRHVRAGAPPRRIVAWRLGLQSIASHWKMVFSILRAEPDDDVLVERLSTAGLPHLERWLRKRGIVAVAPHVGPYPTLGLMAGVWLRRQGFDGEIAVVVRLFDPLGAGALMAWFARKFAGAGITIVPASEPPLRMARTLRNILRDHGVVILFVDEPGPSPSLQVLFFDGSIRIPTGPIRLARATGSVILPCAARFGPRHAPSLVIEPGIEPEGSTTEVLSKVARSIETLIRDHLGQWSMLTPIWINDEEHEQVVGDSQGLADLHLHTTGSDGLCTVTDWRGEAETAGLQVIAITDHDFLDAVLDHKAPPRSSPSILPGVEITARGRVVHVGVLFPEEIPVELPRPGTPLLEVVRWARSVRGSIVVLVHPLPLLWRLQLRRMARAGLLPDAIETRFPLVGWRSGRLEQAAKTYGLATLGGSDAHLTPSQLGRYATTFPGSTVEDLVSAIRVRQTRAVTRSARHGTLPPRLYLYQCLYSWLFPLRRSRLVATVRARLLRAARAVTGVTSGE